MGLAVREGSVSIDYSKMLVILAQVLALVKLGCSSPYWWIGGNGQFGGTEEQIDHFDNTLELEVQLPESTLLEVSLSEIHSENPGQPPNGYFKQQVYIKFNGNFFLVIASLECIIGWKCVDEMYCDVTGKFHSVTNNYSVPEINRRASLLVSKHTLN